MWILPFFSILYFNFDDSNKYVNWPRKYQFSRYNISILLMQVIAK